MSAFLFPDRLQDYWRYILVAIALAALGTAYWEGVERKYDTRITHGFQNDSWQMAIAISRVTYGLHKGYLGYRNVVDVLQSEICPKGIHNPDCVNQLQSREALENAMNKARSLNWDTLPRYQFESGEFVTVYGEDVGQADLYTLAFLLFGYHANSMYRVYFLIMACSLFAFAWTFRKDAFALAMLALVQAGFAAMFYSNLFDNTSMPSVNSNRFGSTLGFIPILHLLCLLRHREFNWQSLLLLALQGVIFMVALSIRSTGKWQIAFAMGVIAVSLLLAWKRTPAGDVFRQRLRAIACCLAVFMGTVGAYAFTQRQMLNDIYFTSCVIPYHVTWHSMVLGLSLHPDWPEYNDISPAMRGDGIAWHAFERRMGNRYDLYTCLSTGGLHQVRLHETVMKEIYLDFAERNPHYMIELHRDYKPRAIRSHLRTMLKGIMPSFWYYYLALCALLGAVTALLETRRRHTPWGVLAAGGLAFLCAALPYIVAYPNPIMADLMWMVVINTGLWGWTLAYRLFPLKAFR